MVGTFVGVDAFVAAAVEVAWEGELAVDFEGMAEGNIVENGEGLGGIAGGTVKDVEVALEGERGFLDEQEEEGWEVDEVFDRIVGIEGLVVGIVAGAAGIVVGVVVEGDDIAAAVEGIVDVVGDIVEAVFDAVEAGEDVEGIVGIADIVDIEEAVDTEAVVVGIVADIVVEDFVVAAVVVFVESGIAVESGVESAVVVVLEGEFVAFVVGLAVVIVDGEGVEIEKGCVL